MKVSFNENGSRSLKHPREIEDWKALAFREKEAKFSPAKRSPNLLTGIETAQKESFPHWRIFLLPGLLKDLMCYRHGMWGDDEHSVEDTAVRFGFQREEVRDLESRALRYMRGERVRDAPH